MSSGARNAFLAPRFDPVDRLLTVEIAGSALDPAVVWRLRVEGTVRDLDRHPMGDAFEIAFRTGEDAIGEEPSNAPSFSDVAPIFFERCAECHDESEPTLGLDLSSGEGIARTAIGVPALGARIGVIADRAWHGTSTLAGLARIDVAGGVGRPAQSYLLYKVLGDPHAGGSRMPPEPRAPLSTAELRLLSRWIAAGAPTD